MSRTRACSAEVADEPRMLLTRLCALLAKICLMFAVAGLVAIIVGLSPSRCSAATC